MSAVATFSTFAQPWTRDALVEGHFVGFLPFSALSLSDVPRLPGVYAVLRTSEALPRFTATSPAGRLKGKDPSVSIETLAAKWVDGPQVLYIGKATTGSAGPRGLQKRLDDLRRFGAGEAANHPGGKYLWQLEDRDELLVAWNATYEAAATVESRMLGDFVARYDALPFANIRR